MTSLQEYAQKVSSENQHIKLNSSVRCENARERICNYKFSINS